MLERKEHKHEQTNSLAEKKYQLPRILTDRAFPSEQSEANAFYAELATSKTVYSLTISERDLMESYRASVMQLCQEKLLVALCKNTTIKTFTYQDSVRGILLPVLSEWLAQNASLREVTFSGINVGRNQIITALCNLNHLKRLHFSLPGNANVLPVLLAKMPKLEKLTVNSCSEEDAIAIVEAVADQKSVHCLTLGGSQITNVGLKKIANILKDCHFLTTLDLSVDYSTRKIRNFSEAFDDMFTLIQLNQSIAELILDGWKMSNDDAAKIAAELKKNSSLRKISLEGTPTSKEMQSIFEALKLNSTLNSVDFRGGLSEIDLTFKPEEFLKSNENICHLHFSRDRSSQLKSAELHNQRQFFTLFGRHAEVIDAACHEHLPRDIVDIIERYVTNKSQPSQVIFEASDYLRRVVEDNFSAQRLRFFCDNDKTFGDMIYSLGSQSVLTTEETISLLEEMLQFVKENKSHQVFIPAVEEVLQCIKEVAKGEQQKSIELGRCL